jgi:hypothetical protein
VAVALGGWVLTHFLFRVPYGMNMAMGSVLGTMVLFTLTYGGRRIFSQPKGLA